MHIIHTRGTYKRVIIFYVLHCLTAFLSCGFFFTIFTKFDYYLNHYNHKS